MVGAVGDQVELEPIRPAEPLLSFEARDDESLGWLAVDGEIDGSVAGCGHVLLLPHMSEGRISMQQECMAESGQGKGHPYDIAGRNMCLAERTKATPFAAGKRPETKGVRLRARAVRLQALPSRAAPDGLRR